MPLNQPSELVARITAELAKPFSQDEVKFKPQAVKNNKALALAYVDARCIQDRMDEVVGVENWCDEYELLPDGSAICRLKVKMGDEWVTKMDVGSPSEQPDAGDRVKAAFSDALKRAAVKFGVGRYLYRLPAQWCDYDPARRQFTRTPALPQWAAGETSTSRTDANSAKRQQQQPPQRPAPQQAAPKASAAHAPKDGGELLRRLKVFDEQNAAKGLSRPGDLLRHMAEQGKVAGFGDEVETWTGPALSFAVEVARTWAQQITPPPEPHDGATLAAWVKWQDADMERRGLAAAGRLSGWIIGAMQKEKMPPLEKVTSRDDIGWVMQSCRNYQQAAADKRTA